MTTTITNGTVTSFGSTPQAVNDLFSAASTGFTEDSTGIIRVDVTANDLGGAAKSLYSLDNGVSGGGLRPTDLLTKDTARTEVSSTDTSLNGAKIWIMADGMSVGYDVGTLSSTFRAQLQHLGAGQFLTDSFTYAIRLGNGALSWATAILQITGTNDAPVVSRAVTGVATEDGSASTLDALAHASDVDDGTVLTVVNVPAAPGLPAGVTYNAGSHSFTLDPANIAFQHLAAGETTTVSVSYGVSDGTATTAASMSWTITGTNDAPVLNAAATPVLTSIAEDAGAPIGAVGTLISTLVNLNPPAGGLDNVTDADNGAVTAIALTGVNTTNGTWWYSTNGAANWTAVGAVSNTSALLLAADANTRIYFQGNLNFNGAVSDGITFRAWDETSGTAGTKVSTLTNGGGSAFSSGTDTASITVSAVNDNPVAVADRIIVSNSTLVTIAASALLGNDTDIDGLALTITSVSGAAGISGLMYDAANGTITFTSGNAAGPTAGSFQYTVSDGAGGTSTATATIDIRSVASGNTADTIDLSTAGNYQASFIDGRGGADTLTGGAAGDIFIGGAGTGADNLIGSAGNDLLIGGDGSDTLSGGPGNDVLRGGLGNNDSMDGGAGTEDLLDFSDGTVGITFTLAQGGTLASPNSIANGTGGLGNNDTYLNMEGVIGTNLNDTITGSSSNDIIRGGAGNDALDAAGGAADLLDLSDGTAGLAFTLTQGSSLTTVSAPGLGTDTYKNFEGVIGTGFADTITGSSLADELRGGGGNDVINGLAGNDRIIGGLGADTLTGGTGSDTFVFDTAPNAVDSITDFNASGSVASGDLIELSFSTFNAITTASGSTLAASEFMSANGGGVGMAVGAAVHVIYDSATGNLYYDLDGLSAANRTLVATLTLSNSADTLDHNDIRIGL